MTIPYNISRWYIRRAYHNYVQAKRLLNNSNVESIISSYESIEFSIKAICCFLDVKFGHKHFTTATTLSALAKKIEEKKFGNSREILQIIPVILSYTDELRSISRYGIVQEGFPPVSPDELFRREYTESVLNDAETLLSLLRKIEIKNRWQPEVKVGILNGYVRTKNENKCAAHPFSYEDSTYWKNNIERLGSLSGKKFNVKDIYATEISEEFAIVLNPFGEEYPEIDIKTKSIFYLIKDYVENGGVYINTGGFPFFYAWDVTAKEKNEIPICEKTILMPKEIEIKNGDFSIKQFQQYLDFTGTLLFKEFNAIPPIVSKPRRIFQDKEDYEKFGDLSTTEEIKEFRAMPKGTKDCIPIVRAEEVYPICALRRGYGYLLLAGMNTEGVKEADLFVKAIIGFCNWFINQL